MVHKFSACRKMTGRIRGKHYDMQYSGIFDWLKKNRTLAAPYTMIYSSIIESVYLMTKLVHRPGKYCEHCY
ncbi:exportin-7 X2 [Biomphalaria glabrata]|nr:exportin-7 X2 [Biomphalaria glabrata]